MPFSKRKLTWSEEVFAGLIVLVLVIAGVTLWFWAGPANIIPGNTSSEVPLEEKSVSALTSEEKQQLLTQMDTDGPHLTDEEREAAVEEYRSGDSPALTEAQMDAATKAYSGN